MRRTISIRIGGHLRASISRTTMVRKEYHQYIWKLLYMLQDAWANKLKPRPALIERDLPSLMERTYIFDIFVCKKSNIKITTDRASSVMQQLQCFPFSPFLTWISQASPSSQANLLSMDLIIPWVLHLPSRYELSPFQFGNGNGR